MRGEVPPTTRTRRRTLRRTPAPPHKIIIRWLAACLAQQLSLPKRVALENRGMRATTLCIFVLATHRKLPNLNLGTRPRHERRTALAQLPDAWKSQRWQSRPRSLTEALLAKLCLRPGNFGGGLHCRGSAAEAARERERERERESDRPLGPLMPSRRRRRRRAIGRALAQVAILLPGGP